MGVYIEGVEMPKNCGSCPLRRGDCLQRIYMEKRPDNCPLVPVPLHGRLIDASESIRVELYDEEHEDWTRHDMTIDDLLSQSWVDAAAPTIIPASEEGELQELERSISSFYERHKAEEGE